MKLMMPDIADPKMEHGEALAEVLQSKLNPLIGDYSEAFVQDLSHISQAANYAGNLAVDQVEYLKNNLYRCDYSYDWSIAWTCSGTQDAGRVQEKVRFTVAEDGTLQFQFLKFD